MDPKIEKILNDIKTLQEEYIAKFKDKEMQAHEFAHHVRSITCMEIAYNVLYGAEYKPKKADKK